MLCGTAVALLGAWMAITTVGVAGPGGFQLQVPASYLSVGQQFEPRLVSLTGAAATLPAAVTLTLLSAGGRVLATQRLALAPPAPAVAAPLALPRPGAFVLRARSGKITQSIPLHALPEPEGGYGGVLALASVGLPPGAADYLRQHGFAVTQLHGVAPPSPPGLILIGDARLDGRALAMQYRWIWKQVAFGAQALALEPPPPGVAAYWPAIGPLVPAPGACPPAPADDPPLYAGVHPGAALRALLGPSLAFALAPAAPRVYAWNGTRLADAGACRAVFSLRYGHGWITVSTLPLLQHFQDVRARLVLMNLIKAAALRKHYQLSTDRFASATARRLAALPAHDPGADQAVFFRSPPAAVEPAAELVPLAAGTCWRAPVLMRGGARLRLDLRRAQPVRSLHLAFGPGADGRPVAFTLAASPDGAHWTPLADPPAARRLALPLPPGNWRAIRLGLPVPSSGWQLCGFSAH